jgi:branched-chain amino acid transport system ATP-binding protein
MLALTNVKSGYGGSEVLRGLNLVCAEGKITVIIGPNGVGKTTLLKTVLKLVKLISGKIVFDNEDVSSLDTPGIIRRGIAYVPQGANVFPQMTVKENLLMGGYTLGSESGVRSGIDNVLRLFPVLHERLTQNAGFLSGGERRMLAIARAMVSTPRLLLLDEPSVGLDVGKQQILYDKMLELNRNGLAVMLTEQNVKKALEVAHFVYVLKGGLVRYEGTPADLNKIDVKQMLFGT